MTTKANDKTPDKRGFVPLFDSCEYENLNDISDIKEVDNSTSNVFGDTSLNDIEMLRKLYLNQSSSRPTYFNKDRSENSIQLDKQEGEVDSPSLPQVIVQLDHSNESKTSQSSIELDKVSSPKVEDKKEEEE